MLLTVLHFAYLVSYSYQINFPGWGLGAGSTETKANSASQQSWSWGLAELGDRNRICRFFVSLLCKALACFRISDAASSVYLLSFAIFALKLSLFLSHNMHKKSLIAVPMF